MANMLNQQYKPLFTTPKRLPDVSIKPAQNGNSLSEITTTDKDIKGAIDDLAITSAPGPDGITASIYKEFAHQLIYTIKKIWQASLESGKSPEGTAQAIITPVYKGGVRRNPAYYRPVTLTDHLTKMVWRILKKSMVEYLFSNEFMNST